MWWKTWGLITIIYFDTLRGYRRKEIQLQPRGWMGWLAGPAVSTTIRLHATREKIPSKGFTQKSIFYKEGRAPESSMLYPPTIYAVLYSLVFYKPITQPTTV